MIIYNVYYPIKPVDKVKESTPPPSSRAGGSAAYGSCDDVSSRYRKVDRIGEGTYGVVYRAVDRATGAAILANGTSTRSTEASMPASRVPNQRSPSEVHVGHVSAQASVSVSARNWPGCGDGM